MDLPAPLAAHAGPDAPPRAIGSVLPWPAATAPCSDSLWAGWTRGHRNAAAYGSARAALAALLAARGIRRLWLPAYCCPALAQAAGNLQVRWYGVDATLVPELASLAAGLRAGDAVLAIAYFGRTPGVAIAALAATRPDVLWIEDRAQAVQPGSAAWAEVTLYSPRKLVGVAEGGLLVSDAALPSPAGLPQLRSAAAQRARAADPDGRAPERWFAQFRAQEAAFALDDAPMDAQTRAALQSLPARPIAARRQANAALLARHLPHLALWTAVPEHAPLAFPIRVRDAAALAADLAARRIFCARHWPDLPSDEARFPLAHRLSGELLSLPCDQRYGAADMARIAAAVRASGARPAP